MTGKTHLKVGVLFYCILVLSGLTLALPIIKIGTSITLAGILVAGFAALAADVDSRTSIINQGNILVKAEQNALDWVEKRVIFVIRVGISLGFAYLVVRYSDSISQAFANLNVKYLSSINSLMIKAVGALIGLVGVFNNRLIKKLPIIGQTFNMFEDQIQKVFDIIKNVIYILIFIVAGLALSIYNFRTSNSVYLYLFAVLLVAIAVFPHRSFFHSLLEGLLLTSIVAFKGFEALGYPYLGWCFVAGYTSHILLTDMLTKEGVWITVLHKVLDKLLIGKILYSRFSWYKSLYKGFSKIKLRVPLMSTGTTWGNIFETFYVLLLIVLVVILYLTNGISFKII